MVDVREARSWGIAAAAVGACALLLLLGLFNAPGAKAGGKHCAVVVTALGSGLTSASVLVVEGRADCEHSRRVIYKALSTSYYKDRQIEGWDCHSTVAGNGVFGASCSSEGEVGREVIKSSKPKRCPSCNRPRD